MIISADSHVADVVVSYSSHDRQRVVQIVEYLESMGVNIWRDDNEILGGKSYGPEIVSAIRQSKVLLLMCSNASMASKNVKQEIQIAWNYGVSYLPLLLEQICYPEQVEYWLTGWEWIEILDRPFEYWSDQVTEALLAFGVSITSHQKSTIISPKSSSLLPGLEGLWSIAGFTDRIWPIPADCEPISGLRDLGAPQEHMKHSFPLGSRVRLVIESDYNAYLLLLDLGTSGAIYCLCPSKFAPDTRIAKGRNYLPQEGAPYQAFEVFGGVGREHLLAIISYEPLNLNWMPKENTNSVLVVDSSNIEILLTKLRLLDGNQWIALSTYFDVTR